MTDRALLAGTLAGILSGVSYLSTPSIAEQPSTLPSPAPSATSLEDIAKLQEKMRDVCINGWKYTKMVGNYNLRVHPPANPSDLETDYSDPGFLKVLNELYSKKFPKAIPIFIYISNKEVLTLNKEGDPAAYSTTSHFKEGPLSRAIIRAYEGVQRRAQEGATGLKTSVRVLGDTTTITNFKTQIKVNNNISDGTHVAERCILLGKPITSDRHQISFENLVFDTNALGINDNLLIIYWDDRKLD